MSFNPQISNSAKLELEKSLKTHITQAKLGILKEKLSMIHVQTQ